MRTRELIVAELLKDGKITAEDAAVLLTKEVIYVPVQQSAPVIPSPPPWQPNDPWYTQPFITYCAVN